MRIQTFRLGFASLALAGAPAVGAGDVNLSMGSYSHVVPIEVPAFHGLELKLALAYSSQAGNGFAGVGWSLGGFSSIEWGRTGEAQWGGSPDKYFLDGQELIACQTGSVSPSCTTGGTHSTKIESYLKIKFDTSANTWTVWGKDGTKTTFSPTLILGPYTVRYGQTSTVDTYGNTVTYGWACQGGDCFPDTVSYNGYTISVFRELRPDILSFAEGYGLGTTQYRLRSVIVQLGTTPIRGYKLTYTTSSVTGRSLIASVQQYGKDLVHSSGAISAGSTLPAQTFTYQNDALGHTFQGATPPPTPPTTVENVQWVNIVGVSASGEGNSLTRYPGQEGDTGASSNRAIASGDGWMEFTYPGGFNFSGGAGLSNGDSNASLSDIDYGFHVYYTALSVLHQGGQYGGWSLGANDRLRVEVSGGFINYKRNGSLLLQLPATPSYPLLVDTSLNENPGELLNVTISGALIDVAPWCSGSPMMGDVNGDGRTDLVCYPVAGKM
jgi:Salmonella virulence plasmid 65kDa B protein